MSKIVGIDLGTTNSLVATVDSGIPYVMDAYRKEAMDIMNGKPVRLADAAQ